MQGYLSEIDIRSILQLIELGQRTGILYLESYGSSSAKSPARLADVNADLSEVGTSWLVFLANGQLVYAGPNDNCLDRLRDYLKPLGMVDDLPGPGTTSTISSLNSLEYGTLWLMLEKHLLSPDQGRTMLSHMVRETLFDLLSLHHGSFVFQLTAALSPQLMIQSISTLVTGLTQQIQTWHQFHPLLQSPDQCLTLVNPEGFTQILPDPIYTNLNRWLTGQTSLRQVARYLQQDLVTVAERLLPAIQAGYLTVDASPIRCCAPATPHQISSQRQLRVVCVDDSATVRASVENILEHQGYAATSIGNPLKALGLLFQLQPDLILCDIAMPELDGYELCAMLRQASAFRQIPIVMLTGKDAFLDRVKARMVGATDYLTKPFGSAELTALVEKYLGPGDLNGSSPDRLLTEAIRGEVDLDLGTIPV
jgi:twitching motility two-component system response regulator PilG